MSRNSHQRNRISEAALSLFFFAWCLTCRGSNIPPDVNFYENIVYAHVAGKPLLLDLYIPRSGSKPFPVLIWIHGGGWIKGSKSNALPVVTGFTDKGYAVASLSYRFSNEAIFPAQIWDCKAGVRFLRGNAEKYGLDANSFGVWGDSAGGHLAALLGTTSGSQVLDGNEGSYLSYSSRVQAVCDYYGPTDFSTIWNNDPNSMWLRAGNYGERLIGGSIPENPLKARAASPLTYVSKNAVPFLIVHGKEDRVVPVSQSTKLYEALKKASVDAQIRIIEGAGHSGKSFIDPNVIEKVQSFFDGHLKTEHKNHRS